MEQIKICENLEELKKCVPPWGASIIVTTRTVQNRKHKKRRINKKWRKRYGVTKYEYQNYDIIFVNGNIYVTEKGMKIIKEISHKSE
jgi:hypothetical protein